MFAIYCYKYLRYQYADPYIFGWIANEWQGRISFS